MRQKRRFEWRSQDPKLQASFLGPGSRFCSPSLGCQTGQVLPTLARPPAQPHTPQACASCSLSPPPVRTQELLCPRVAGPVGSGLDHQPMAVPFLGGTPDQPEQGHCPRTAVLLQQCGQFLGPHPGQPLCARPSVTGCFPGPVALHHSYWSCAGWSGKWAGHPQGEASSLSVLCSPAPWVCEI